MVLHTLINRGSLVIPEALKPAAVAAAIVEFGVTHVSATPTFWRVFLAQLAQLSQPSIDVAARIPLEQITLGAEPVPPGLLEDLHAAFPRARVSQVFAATEAGSCLAISDGQPGLPASILDRGPDADVQFRIADGALQIRSRHGMLGYVGEDDASEDGWRATGDLVERRGDRIHFVGRTSETINVGGVKVHPIPIEERAQSVSGVRLAHAYGRRNAITGHIVALDVVPAADADTSALEQRIRAACESLPRPARPRIVRFVDALETRNQKILRRAS
jgi:acyl-CoA synthetase (AMP-forming)/AMP-acid ligase II